MTHRTDNLVARSVTRTLACALVLAGTSLYPSCKSVEVTTIVPAADIGDPCIPEEEANPWFSNFNMTEVNILADFAGCNSGICLINHFQGRASCPLGQAAPARCAGPGDASCGESSACVAVGWEGPHCDSGSADNGASQCASGVCNAQWNRCECATDAQCPEAGTVCDPQSKECTRYVCKSASGCQSDDASEAENAGKACCQAGSSRPVLAAVCGQCTPRTGRSAAAAVTCSCRCGLADGAPDDGSPLCTCPGGFECAQIRPNIGLGDPSLTGKYCIKQGTAYTGPDSCDEVHGQCAKSLH